MAKTRFGDQAAFADVLNISAVVMNYIHRGARSPTTLQQAAIISLEMAMLQAQQLPALPTDVDTERLGDQILNVQRQLTNAAYRLKNMKQQWAAFEELSRLLQVVSAQPDAYPLLSLPALQQLHRRRLALQRKNHPTLQALLEARMAGWRAEQKALEVKLEKGVAN